MSRAMAVLLAAAAAVLALIVPLDHGAPFIVGLITTGVVVGGGIYVASTPNKKSSHQNGHRWPWHTLPRS